MTGILWIDTETFSETPIKDGTYVYAQNAEVMLVTYAIGDGPVQYLDLTIDVPEEWWILSDLLKKADTIIASNAMFDRTVLRLNRQHRIDTPIEKWRCCMVKALAHGLPGGLSKLCNILNVGDEHAKKETGKHLIQLFCKPRKFTHRLLRSSFATKAQFDAAVEEARANWPGRATRETHPKEWAEFIEYAKSDISAMREAWKKLPSWNYGETGAGAKERDLWHIDQKMNDRGMLIDLELADAAIEETRDAKAALADEINGMTDGYVTSATKRDRLLEYLLIEYGIDLPDLKGPTAERLLDNPAIDDGAKACLRNRLAATMSSTAKYTSVRKAVNADGRLRGCIQFNGAARTRRDGGRTFQPQNLPSRGLLPADDIVVATEAIKLRATSLFYDNVMLAATSCIRGLIVAPPGKKLVIVDLSNIEGRGLAYMAGETWKLNAFRAFDAGEGEDLYKLAYAKSFRVDPKSVNKFQRSIGKVQELALGYAGGVNAFVTFADAYGIDLDAMAEEAWPALPNETVAEAEDFLEWMTKQKRSTHGLSHRAFITCEVFKRLWRQAHPNVVSFWSEIEDAARSAINNPGRTFEGRCFKARRDGAWLRIVMPSGRALCYPSPQVEDDGGITYMGVNQFTRKWMRIRTYGGKLSENFCQGMSRDIMFDNIPSIEAAGYEIITRVHDELPAEAPDSPEFNADHMGALLATPPVWAPDIPLAAAGFEDYRYRKD